MRSAFSHLLAVAAHEFLPLAAKVARDFPVRSPKVTPLQVKRACSYEDVDDGAFWMSWADYAEHWSKIGRVQRREQGRGGLGFGTFCHMACAPRARGVRPRARACPPTRKCARAPSPARGGGRNISNTLKACHPLPAGGGATLNFNKHVACLVRFFVGLCCLLCHRQPHSRTLDRNL